jgi:hypothetical protein
MSLVITATKTHAIIPLAVFESNVIKEGGGRGQRGFVC